MSAFSPFVSVVMGSALPGNEILISHFAYLFQIPALQDHNYASRPPPTPPPSPAMTSASTGFMTSPAPTATELLARAAMHQQQQSLLGQVSLAPPPPAVVVNAAVGANAVPRPQTREEQNHHSIEEAGVGPMAPLMDSDSKATDDEDVDVGDKKWRRKKKAERSKKVSPKKRKKSVSGEETETANETDDEKADKESYQDDSITRCICDFLHDDGYMICCDKCSVWQHVVCMGLDRHNIPDEYLCEVCRPRPVDRKRARAMQSRRKMELFRNSSSSDNDNDNDKAKRANNKRYKDKRKKSAVIANKKAKTKTKKINRRKSGEKVKIKPPARKLSTARSNLDSDSDLLDSDESSMDDDNEDDLLEPQIDDPSQHLRSWIDQYEEAVTNHYSQELRARLANGLNHADHSELRASAIGGPVRCSVSLKGNGVKILTASTNISSNTPIIECKGKVMLASQFRKSASSPTKQSFPHVFFHKLGDGLEICLDGKTYGNDSRFCRRSNNYNADLKHVVDKGSLHLFIVAVKAVDKNQEIVLPPMEKTSSKKAESQPLQSINADLKEITSKKANGIVKKANKKLVKSNNKPRKKSQDVEENDEDNDVDDVTAVNGEKSPSAKSPPASSTASAKASPAKLGLPDSSGLIVGVNTINYDASSSLKNKAKSREERKMEMIMKAIEQMERAEQRKREQRPGCVPADGSQ